MAIIDFKKAAQKAFLYFYDSNSYSLEGEVQKLRVELKNKSPKSVYTLAKGILEKEPHHEFASYASSWAALKLKKYGEISKLISPALKANPDKYSYWDIYTEALVRDDNYQKAWPSLQKVIKKFPSKFRGWKNYMKVGRELGLPIQIPKIYKDLETKIEILFMKRNWEQFDLEMKNLQKLDPIAVDYWILKKNEQQKKIINPPQDWSIFIRESKDQNHHYASRAEKDLDNASEGKTNNHNRLNQVSVTLEDPKGLPHVNWRMLYLGANRRYSLATGVNLLSPNTFVCTSLLARKMYVYRFDFDSGTHELVDEIQTLSQGAPTETDLLDLNSRGDILASNCASGDASIYRWENERLNFVTGVPIFSGSWVHGAKFFNDKIAVGTLSSKPYGVCFSDIGSGASLLHVDIEDDFPTKDICFINENTMVVVLAENMPKGSRDHMWNSQVRVYEIDLKRRKYRLSKKRTPFQNHVDSILYHEGKLYGNEQLNDHIYVLDSDTLETVGKIEGYNCPHDVDIRYGMIAVANYGSNSIDIRKLPTID